MKLINSKNIAIATFATTMMASIVNATNAEMASSSNLTNWIEIIATILGIFCLVIFVMYLTRYLVTKKSKKEDANDKLNDGLKNGMITTLIGVVICEATIIIVNNCLL